MSEEKIVDKELVDPVKATTYPPDVEKILVVPTEEFHKLGHFNGFSADVRRYLPLLDSPYRAYKVRPEMEVRPEWKQLIPYMVFVKDHKIFTYYRSKKQGEQRLHGKRSMGVGGHINSGDLDYDSALTRELEEEVRFNVNNGCALFDRHPIGFINDDDTDVGKVHLGIVHFGDLRDGEDLVPAEPEDMLDAAYLTLEEALADLESFETWSQLILPNPEFQDLVRRSPSGPRIPGREGFVPMGWRSADPAIGS